MANLSRMVVRVQTDTPKKRFAWRWAALLGMVGSLVGLPVPGATQDCGEVRYQQGKVFSSSPSEIDATVAIDREEFDRKQLLCLAHELRRAYQGRNKIDIFIFDSRTAASQYVPLGTEEPPKLVAFTSHWHARYFLDAGESQEYLLILPDPLSGGLMSPFNTKIDLQSQRPPACKQEIDGRCLVAFDHIEYPWERSTGQAGAITISGSIAPDGTVKGIRVTAGGATPAAGKNLLLHAALNNLKSWRFEAAARTSPLQLTYRYQIVPDETAHGRTEVNFSLPSEIIVTLH